MATYLVTGGCGFIGSHLCDALVNRGDSVRVLDNLSSGSRSKLSPRICFIEGDVADATCARKALVGADGCFHLAAVASVERANRDWIAGHRTNLTGAITIFDAARTTPVPIVYASSAAVYGDSEDLPLREDAEKRPLSPYAADKIGCELHARVASTVFGLSSVGLRFFNVYGPGQAPTSPYSGVISIFCERILRAQPIDIFGQGNQTRDFIFVSDVVAALLRAMDLQLAGAHIFNVCTGRGTSVLNLVRTIAELCGALPQVHVRPRRLGDVEHSCGDPTKARRFLGLGTPTDLKGGLAATLSSLRGAADEQQRSTSFCGTNSAGCSLSGDKRSSLDGANDSDEGSGRQPPKRP
jgi:UDP-glucose 4-epimerase